jgi:hypothetical protein
MKSKKMYVLGILIPVTVLLLGMTAGIVAKLWNNNSSGDSINLRAMGESKYCENENDCINLVGSEGNDCTALVLGPEGYYWCAAEQMWKSIKYDRYCGNPQPCTRDEHGCLPCEGQSWAEGFGKCIYPWEVYQYHFLCEKCSGFGIYYKQKLIISDEDMRYYNKTSHEIKLTPEGVEKIKMHVSGDSVPPRAGGIYGERFVAKLDGDELYDGIFHSAVSSYLYSNEILLGDVLMLDDTVSIELSGIFTRTDLRNNPCLLNYLKSKNKLVE